MTRASSRMGDLPPYPLLAMKETRRRLVAEGVDVIDLGAGGRRPRSAPGRNGASPRGGPAKRNTVGMAFSLVCPEFRESVAAWMATRFGVEVDPWAEILPLIGSKDGIAHLPFGYLDPGDVAVIPDPGYQAYAGGIALSGGEAHRVALRPENDFLIPLEDIPSDVRDRTRMLYLNYPNNPTTAVAPDAYLEESVDFCRQQDAILLQDNAYSEIAFNGYRPRSILEFDGAKDVSVEFHSFSKTYNMTGVAVGLGCGECRGHRRPITCEVFHGHRTVHGDPGGGRRSTGELGPNGCRGTWPRLRDEEMPL